MSHKHAKQIDCFLIIVGLVILCGFLMWWQPWVVEPTQTPEPPTITATFRPTNTPKPPTETATARPSETAAVEPSATATATVKSKIPTKTPVPSVSPEATKDYRWVNCDGVVMDYPRYSWSKCPVVKKEPRIRRIHGWK